MVDKNNIQNQISQIFLEIIKLENENDTKNEKLLKTLEKKYLECYEKLKQK